MKKKDIAVLVTHYGGELLAALESALSLREESEEWGKVALFAVGEGSDTAESAREALYRGVDYAAVVSDPLFGGIEESALLGLISSRLGARFEQVITSGQSNDTRPRNAHLVLRYKRAKTDAERTPDDPYEHLYESREHLRIPSWSAADFGIQPDELNALRGSSAPPSGGRLASESDRQQVIISSPEESRDWTTEVAQMILDARPQRLSRRLRDAQLVVGGGYGIGSEEGFNLLGEFATEIKARLGATRAAVDAEFCPARLMIGPTGERIRPRLYIACGISGQVQHMAGIAEGTTIISINTDPEAPIAEVADYVIVGEVEVLLPLILEEYRRLRTQQ